MNDTLLLSVSDGVATITFNRPKQLNALDVTLAEAFEAAISDLLNTSGVSVVLLRGEGRAFMAGGDIRSFHVAEDVTAAAAAVIDPVHRALKELEASPVISIAAAQGPVAGAGMSIFLGADFGICSDDAVFEMAYSRLGTTADCGGSYALSRLVGLRRALQIALLSTPIKADEALQMGLVNRVVPVDNLTDASTALARQIASGPVVSHGRMKALLRKSFTNDFATQLDLEREGFLACTKTDDFREGLAAFFEKRKPEYSGR